jgi:dipeptidyl aminopeptidase/acylaminoacyl peptidase
MLKKNLVVSFLVLLSSLSFASNQLTPEMVMNIKSISNPKISPDGNYVAYLKIIPPAENEGKKYRYSELNLLDLNSKESKSIKKMHSKSSSAPIKYQWSQDSQTLYYTAKYEEFHDKKQIYKISLRNYEPELITKHATGISNFEISKDEKNIIFLAKKKNSQKEEDLKNNGHDWIINEQKFDLNHLFTWNIEYNKILKISPDSLHVFSFVLEPDGKNIIYQAAKQSNSDYSYMFRDIYRVAVDGANNKKLLDHDGKLGKMVISPDGKYLAFLGGIDISDPAHGSLLINKIGSNKWTDLTKEFEGSLTDVDWLDNQTLVFCAETYNHTSLYKINLVSGEKHLIFGKGEIFKSIDLTDDSNLFVCTVNEYNHPNELYLGDLNKNKIERLTDSNPGFKTISFFKPEEFKWQSRDSVEIQGIVIKPEKFATDASAPLYVYVHGGPEGARQIGWNNWYNNWPQIMAQKGAVVFIPNYRGSTGRGVQFSKGDHGDMMGVDFNDVLDGIDALIEKKWINPEKVGIAGGSYGGYMTAWASTQYSDRFAVGVMSAGISNQISKIGMTDTPHENALVHWNGYSWDTNFDLAWERSPLKYFKYHKTPLLITHGAIDKRVPTGQAYELYRALKHNDQAPVKLIIYPDEKHGLKMRAHRYHFMINALNWLEKYLFSEN